MKRRKRKKRRRRKIQMILTRMSPTLMSLHLQRSSKGLCYIITFCKD
jgi:hypothetical protein